MPPPSLAAGGNDGGVGASVMATRLDRLEASVARLEEKMDNLTTMAEAMLLRQEELAGHGAAVNEHLSVTTDRVKNCFSNIKLIHEQTTHISGGFDALVRDVSQLVPESALEEWYDDVDETISQEGPESEEDESQE